jgi:hypothetical protein
MARGIIAIVLSAMTFIGGHFVNRRWDRALLFIGLVPVWTLLLFLQLSYGHGTPLMDASQVKSGMLLFGYGLTAIWALSVLVTGWDAFKGENHFPLQWTASSLFGAAALSLLTLVWMPGTIVWWLNFDIDATAGVTHHTSSHHTPHLRSHHFWFSENYGGVRDGVDRKAPPAGDHYLNMRFVYDGKPAAGVKFKVVLSKTYQSKRLVSDRDGMVHLPLPAGTVHLNKITIDGWDDAPDLPLTVTNGHEKRLEENASERFDYFGDGIAIETQASRDGEPFTFTIRPKIQLQWPTHTVTDAAVAVDKASVRWQPLAGAAHYRLVFTRINRRGDGATYQPVVTRQVDSAAPFPLASLPTMQKTDDQEYEYTVTVQAFSEDGAYLSESPAHYNTDSFKLADGLMLMEDELVENRKAPSIESYLLRRKDRERLDTVRDLIDDSHYEVAAGMLATISPEYKAEHQATLRAYLLAKQGQCDAALKQLPATRKKDECGCLYDKVQELCSPADTKQKEPAT